MLVERKLDAAPGLHVPTVHAVAGEGMRTRLKSHQRLVGMRRLVVAEHEAPGAYRAYERDRVRDADSLWHPSSKYCVSWKKHVRALGWDRSADA